MLLAWELGVILSVTLTIVAIIFWCWFIQSNKLELVEGRGHDLPIWTIQSQPCPTHSITGDNPEQCSNRDIETPPPTYESLFGDSR